MRAFLFLLVFANLAVPATAGIVTSPEVSDVSVTIYRDPRRNEGAMNANWPGGYALISETRTITIPAGDSQIRFENVAEGLMPETAIVTGLPSGVREKNRDARLISPAGLVDAYLKRSVRIRRTDRATGKVTEQDAIIQTGPNGGVILKTKDGFEALSCSGLPERMTYGGIPESLTARPTLSVLTRSDRAVTVKIQLTYMAQGFDWSANYVGTMAGDAKTMGLFAWLTVANGGAQSFKDARMQVIGGKPNKGNSPPPPAPSRPALELQCWPVDITSTHEKVEWERMPLPMGFDLSVYNQVGRNEAGTFRPRVKKKGRAGNSLGEITVTATRRERLMQSAPMAVSVMSADMAFAPPPPPPSPEPSAPKPVQAQQEELGDLKLYRVPMRVTVAAKSQKQVAMINQPAAAFVRVYTANVQGGSSLPQPMQSLLRSQNVKDKGLGLPLPAGSLALFETVDKRNMLAGQHDMADLAVGEDVELSLGGSPDVQWRLSRVSETDHKQGWDVEITNAKPVPIKAEILVPYDLAQKPEGLERGIGGWKLPIEVAANDTAKLHYSLKIDEGR